MCGYIPTDHLNPDTGQMDNKDDDELLLTTREKNGKNDDILRTQTIV